MSTIPAAPHDAARGADDAELDARFAPVFERIAAGSIEREQNRELAYEAVRWLKEAGFTALRVPKRYGGSGVSLPQFFRLLTRLGEADSNLPQILRLNSGLSKAGSKATTKHCASAGCRRSRRAKPLVRRSPNVRAARTTPSHW